MKVFLTLFIFGLCYGQLDSLIQLENGTTLKNLDELTRLNIEELNCQNNLLQISHQLKMWRELYKAEKVIHKEIKVLSNAIENMKELTFNRHKFSETLKSAKLVLSALKHNTHKNQHTLYQQWRGNEIKKIQKEIKLLEASTTESDSNECCDRIEKLVNKYLDERKHITKQCNDPKVTINIITDKENQVEVINQTCKNDDNSVKVNKVDSNNVIVGQSQDQKKEVIVTKNVESNDSDRKIDGNGSSETEKQQVEEKKVEQQPTDGSITGDVISQQPEQQEVIAKQVQSDDVDGNIDGSGSSEQVSQQVDQKTEESEIVDGTVKGEGIVGEPEQSSGSDQTVEADDVDGRIDGDAQYDSEETETQEQTTEVGDYLSGEVAGSAVEYSDDEESVVTQTTQTKTVTQPVDNDDDDVEGEIVQTQGVGASGQGRGY